jgi:hypothetical protein
MGVSYDQIKQWKSLHKDIYKLVINDSIYVFRSLKISECENVKYLINNASQNDIEDYVASCVTIYPFDLDIDKEPAGNIAYLAKCAIELAGFFNRETFLKLLKDTKEAASSEFTNDFFLWKLAILQTFQGYTFEDLDEMSSFEFMKLVRICENVKQETFVDVDPMLGEEKIPVDIIDVPSGTVPAIDRNMYYSAFETAAFSDPNKLNKKKGDNA